MSQRKDLSKKHEDKKHKKEVKKESKSKSTSSSKHHHATISPESTLIAGKLLIADTDQTLLDESLNEFFSASYLKGQQKFVLGLEAKLNAAVEGNLKAIPTFVAKQLAKPILDDASKINLEKILKNFKAVINAETQKSDGMQALSDKLGELSERMRLALEKQTEAARQQVLIAALPEDKKKSFAELNAAHVKDIAQNIQLLQESIARLLAIVNVINDINTLLKPKSPYAPGSATMHTGRSADTAQTKPQPEGITAGSVAPGAGNGRKK